MRTRSLNSGDGIIPWPIARAQINVDCNSLQQNLLFRDGRLFDSNTSLHPRVLPCHSKANDKSPHTIRKQPRRALPYLRSCCRQARGFFRTREVRPSWSYRVSSLKLILLRVRLCLHHMRRERGLM